MVFNVGLSAHFQSFPAAKPQPEGLSMTVPWQNQQVVKPVSDGTASPPKNTVAMTLQCSPRTTPYQMLATSVAIQIMSQRDPGVIPQILLKDGNIVT